MCDHYNVTEVTGVPVFVWQVKKDVYFEDSFYVNDPYTFRVF